MGLHELIPRLDVAHNENEPVIVRDREENQGKHTWTAKSGRSSSDQLNTQPIASLHNGLAFLRGAPQSRSEPYWTPPRSLAERFRRLRQA